ncbi:unnamed protein product [Vicia faba]|uniref:Glycosyl-hydrolase family 116 N-terminal domain-containing protein n=1 Tax=Vicia faba TaxID=3906 RepID=A0AAV0YLP9_VICFA|nr:unnamed protein product [Vicia faba]
MAVENDETRTNRTTAVEDDDQKQRKHERKPPRLKTTTGNGGRRTFVNGNVDDGGWETAVVTSAAGCTKTETFPALYPRAWTVYEGHISGVMIFVDTSGESLRKMQNSGFIQIINTASKDFTLLFTWANSVGGYILPRARRPDGVHGVLLHHKTASEQSLLTFAIAAEETEYVHISKCPVFVIFDSHKGISAKDMWHEVKQVMDLLSDFIDLCFFEMSMFGVITIKLFILYSGCVAPYKLSLCSKHFITQVLEVSFISFSFCCVPDFFLSVIMTMINT